MPPLSRLVGGLTTTRTPTDPDISAVTEDSRRVVPGALFVAVPGTVEDGAAYIPDAVRRGAAAVLTQAAVPEAPVPVLRVASARAALAEIAARFYGHPGRRLQVIGFTGTFGKTTTSDVLRSVLEASGTPTGVVGSLGARYRDRAIDGSGLTTPAPVELQHMLCELADAGARCVVLEVTSHALLLGRVADLAFDHAIVGAIMPGEHTDFHRTYADYVAAKARLVDQVARGGVLTYDRDNAASRRIAARAPVARAAGLSLGALPEAARDDVTVRRAEVDGDGALFTVRGRDLRSALLGRHNVRNVGMAITAALALGVDLDTVARTLPSLRALPRRLERITAGGRTLLDDTSGRPESLAAAFEAAALVRHTRLVVVYTVRGRRGVAVNAENGAALGDLALLHDAVHVGVTASVEAVGPKDAATPGEIAAAADAVAARGCPFTWHDRLDAAIVEAAAASRPGDLVLLVGAQGMDAGAALLRGALEEGED